MDYNITIGSKIRTLRKEKEVTLKQLSDEFGLSVGFFPQLERGIPSIAIDSLSKIAEILEAALSVFFDEIDMKDTDPVMHSLDMTCIQVSPQIVQFILSNEATDFDVLPRTFQLMSLTNADLKKLEMYCHNRGELIYVLEGIVTVFIGDNKYCFCPGDSIQIHPNHPHNWISFTNKIARILTPNYPDSFKSSSPDFLNL